MDRGFAHRMPGSESSSDSCVRLEAHVSVIAADELAAVITSRSRDSSACAPSARPSCWARGNRGA
jgi:hypothetical protein